MSLRVVNISWDVAPLSSGFAPYGGATILRRTVLASGFLLAVIGLTTAALSTPVLAVVMLIVATVGFKVAASAPDVKPVPSTAAEPESLPRGN